MQFRLHYGFFNAGEAVFEVYPDLYKVNNRVCHKITVHGRTTGAFDMMMRVRDTWGSYMDTAALITQRSYRDIEENSYRLKEYANYFPNENIVKVERHKKGIINEQYTIPDNMQDIVSGFYYLRTIDYSKLKKGDIVKVNAFFEDKIYNMQVIYAGVEKIKTKFGKVDAIKIVPIFPENDLFDGENPISCWLTADENKVPLKVKAQMLVGAVEIDLESYNGLRNKGVFKK